MAIKPETADTYLPLSYIKLWPVIYGFGTLFWAFVIVFVLTVIIRALFRYFNQRGKEGKLRRLERDLVKVFPQKKMENRLQWLRDQSLAAEKALADAEKKGH